MKQTLFKAAAMFFLAFEAEAGWYTEIPPQKIQMELPMDLEKAKTTWNYASGFEVAHDEILNRNVLERTGKASGWIRSRLPIADAPWEIVVLARITTPTMSSGIALSIGTEGTNKAFRADCSVAVRPMPQTSERTLGVSPTFGTNRLKGVNFTEAFPNISPVWDTDFRQEVEAAMAKIPLATDQWFELRLVRRSDSVEIYKNGFLVAEVRPAGRIEGDVYLQVSGRVRLASLVVRQLNEAAGGYVPVALDEHCNASFAMQSDSLPTASDPVVVNQIPFVFPARHAGNDHVNVGESLFHYRNQKGAFDANKTWPAPQQSDSNRICFSVLNRPYTRLWLLAAADGATNHVPLVTVRFYRPRAGFAVDAVGHVPLYTARSSDGGTRALPIKLGNGQAGNLWLVPVDLDAVRIASEFRDEERLSMELTKQVFAYRTCPDPANYGWFQGGLPSGVRIFAMTLEEAPIRLIATGNRTGNAYISPEQPVWRVQLDNLRPQTLDARVRVTVADPAGKSASSERTVKLVPRASTTTELPLATKVFGLHQVHTTVELAGNVFSQEGTFIQLPPDTRKTTAETSRWGLWNWNGAHLTNPNEEENIYLNRAAGSRYCSAGDYEQRRRWGVVAGPQHVVSGPEKWAFADPYDPKAYEEFSDATGKKTAEMLEKRPDAPSFSIFTETAISSSLTYGIPPEYLGEGEYVMNTDEKARLRAFTITLKAACEGIRKHAPKAKIALGWCEPYFAVPFLKEKLPKELFDSIGVDSPQFERMPEMPIREVAPARLWLLQEALKKYGYEKLPVIHTESYYPSSHPLALGERGSADSYVRTAVLSMAQGSTTFAKLLVAIRLRELLGFATLRLHRPRRPLARVQSQAGLRRVRNDVAVARHGGVRRLRADRVALGVLRPLCRVRPEDLLFVDDSGHAPRTVAIREGRGNRADRRERKRDEAFAE